MAINIPPPHSAPFSSIYFFYSNVNSKLQGYQSTLYLSTYLKSESQLCMHLHPPPPPRAIATEDTGVEDVQYIYDIDIGMYIE